MITILTNFENFPHSMNTSDLCKFSSISGKPKMFFIQACQGDQLDSGVHLKRVSNTETDSNSMSYKVG